jgi:hypothetical protein
MTNKELFTSVLADSYALLFREQPEYFCQVVGRYTPIELASKTVTKLLARAGNTHADAVKRTCEILGINYRSALDVRSYLNTQD